MSRTFKLLLVAILGLFILACSLIPNPLSEVENAAATAQAFASEMPLETMQALTTAIPMDTLEALPSALPDFGNYLDPTGTPVEQWNGIPVMPQATVGEEFGASTYGYTVPASSADIQNFYNQKMEEMGWTPAFSVPITEDGGILFYQNDTEFLTITIARDFIDSNSMDVLLQK